MGWRSGTDLDAIVATTEFDDTGLPMTKPRLPRTAGGWHSVLYTFREARRVGGFVRMWKALRAKNACKTCALGMGGQQGGMTNEEGRFPEFCKKSVQAMAADMAGGIRPGFFEEFTFDKLERFSPRQLETAGRITQPLYAGPGDRGYRAISWSEAIDKVTSALKLSRPEETYFYLSGRSSNEAGFLYQLFARAFGTSNVNNCSFYCRQASGVGLASTIGSSTATVTLEDLAHCDMIVLLGGNPASNHPRFMRTLLDLRRRGGKVVAVNPICELGLVNFSVPSDARSLLFGSRMSDEYIQPHIGGDIPFLYGVAKAVLALGAMDAGFLRDHVSGWEEFRSEVERLPWETIVERSGVARERIERIAAMYAASKATIFAWTMGMTHHTHGVDNVRMIANLAFLRGMIGRPGSGLLPLRGHSNVQGLGSMGAVPQLRESMVKAIEKRFGIALPTARGLDTAGSMDLARAGGVRCAIHLGGNLFGSAPDPVAGREAFAKIGTVVYMNTTLNLGHAHGRGQETILLPVRARDEEEEPTTQESMFSYVRYSEGGPERYPQPGGGPMGEVRLIATLARRVLNDSPIDFAAFERHASVREAIAAIVPGYAEIGAMDESKREFHVRGRSIRETRFPTASGRVAMSAVALPEPPKRDRDELILMTIRSEGQFNTVVYEEGDRYRGQSRRDVILMASEDMERLGLAEDDLVTVSSSVGEMPDILVRVIDIRPGNAAMYCPESNVLVPQTIDPESRTPAFKSVLIRVRKARKLTVLR
jgi:molybdopterin-dependent oxidoreductase alpha subunit